MSTFGTGEPSEAFARDPFEALGALPSSCPVRMGSGDEWAVTGRGPILAALRDDSLAITGSSTFNDRSADFRGSVVRTLRAWIAREANGVLPAIVDSACVEATAKVIAAGQADLVSDVARAIPLAVMAGLLGIPAAHRPALDRLAADILSSYDLRSPDDAVIGSRAKQGLDGYFALHLSRTATGSPLLDEMRRIGRELARPPEALADVCTKLLVAGTSTTAGCLASILACLLGDADAYRTCRERADADMPRLVEDLIRLHSPILALKRSAETETEVAGTRIAAGSRVYLFTAAANREGDRADAPCAAAGRRHLSFGSGRHACLGAPLARIEIGTALRHLLPVLPHIRLLEPIRWRKAWLLHEPVAIRIAAS